MFYAGLKYRSSRAKLYQSCNPTVRLEPEFVPWTGKVFNIIARHCFVY